MQSEEYQEDNAAEGAGASAFATINWVAELPWTYIGKNDKQVDRAIRQVAFALARRADGATGKRAYPSLNEIREVTGLDRKSIASALERGIKLGFWKLLPTKSKYGTDWYELQLDADLSNLRQVMGANRAAELKANAEKAKRTRARAKQRQLGDAYRESERYVPEIPRGTYRENEGVRTPSDSTGPALEPAPVDQPVTDPLAPASRSRGTSEVPAEEKQDAQEPVADHTEEEPELIRNFTTSLDKQPDASFVVETAEELNATLDKIFATETPQKASDRSAITATSDDTLQAALDALGPVADARYEPGRPIERRPVPILTPEEVERQVAARHKQPTEAQRKHQEFLEQQRKFDAEYEAANPLPKRSEGVDMVQRAREALAKAPRRRGGRKKKQPAAPENLQSYEGVKYEFAPYLVEPHKAQELVGTPYDPARLFKAYEEALAERGLTMDWQYSGELRRFISAFLLHVGGDENRVAKALQSVLDNESVTHPHNTKVIVTFAGTALLSGLSFIGSKALGIHLRRSA
ncbi:hypothetical protein [Lentzea aerocolonigenes]|uniref:hypothetical protein n=1 Tax=Lentzea aerocolonigenes TaxID=68170 RepID=UPI0004C2C3AC|nr:hypothetical protein [Lentzea aerocolonigenes]MCP2248755.1 hypothetical protein [Lentzea aerocolonigenes]